MTGDLRSDACADGPTFRLLSDRALVTIHRSTLNVLEHTGVFVESEQALDTFADGGCQVDRSKKVVRIPGQVVQDALATCTPVGVLHGRIRRHDVPTRSGHVAFTNFGEGLFVVDPFTGERRESQKADVAAAALLVDAQDNTEVCWRAVGARDVYPGVAALHNADAILRSTTKHAILSPQNESLVAPILDLQAAILGSKDAVRERPLVTLTACPVSPLKLARDCCDIIMSAARNGVGVNIISMTLAGGSGPVTLAGTLVVHNAELLAGITLGQLASQGSSVIYGSVTTGLDLRYAAACVGSPEMALLSAATAELARHYGLPSFVAGGAGDGKLSDAQAGHEKTLTCMLPALAGADLVFGLGMIESGLTFDFGQLVMDAEFAGLARQCLGGIPVRNDTLAIEDIVRVGPFGDFFGLDSTLLNMRDLSQPRYVDRRVREDWQEQGAMDIYQRALAEARRLLTEHQPEPLEAEVLAEMDAVLARTEAEVVP